MCMHSQDCIRTPVNSNVLPYCCPQQGSRFELLSVGDGQPIPNDGVERLDPYRKSENADPSFPIRMETVK